MTIQQYNILYNMLLKQDKMIEDLKAEVGIMSTLLNSLLCKTIVVTDLDKELAALKIDVQSLRDEKEA